MTKLSQHDANFLAGIEVGVRCAEKGMNLQAALEFGKKTIELYPQRDYASKADSPRRNVNRKVKHSDT